MRASRTRLSLCASPTRAPRPPAACVATSTSSCARLESPSSLPSSSTAGNPWCVDALSSRASRAAVSPSARTVATGPAHIRSRAVSARNARGGSPGRNTTFSFLSKSRWYTEPETDDLLKKNAHVALDTATATMMGNAKAMPPVPSTMITTSEMDDRNTPARVAVAPISAYTPGCTSHVAGRKPRSASPNAPPPHAPRKTEGRNTPPGTARPYAAAIRTRYAHALRVNPIAVNPYVAIVACFPLSSPMLSILPITSAGLPNKTLATSLISPSPQRHRSPKSSAAQTAGRATHRPPRDEKRNRVNTVTTTTSTQSSTRATFFSCFGRMKRAKNDVRALNATPATPPRTAVATKNGNWCRKSRGVCVRTACESRNSAPESPVLRHIESVMLAADAHTNERHITLRDQYVEASSKENKTPPTGAPNAAASPAAAPALTNSRRVACDAKSTRTFFALSRDREARAAFAFDRALSSPIERRRSRGASPSSDRGYGISGRSERSTSSSSSASSASSSSSSSSSAKKSRASPSLSHRLGAAKTTHDATAAPTCTMGPSGPTARDDPTAHATPMTLATSALNPSRSGTAVPLRNAITPVTPPPAACGAQKTHSADATETNATHAQTYSAQTLSSRPRSWRKASSSRVSACCAVIRSKMNDRFASNAASTAASMANASAPTQTPTTSAMEDFASVSPVYP